MILCGEVTKVAAHLLAVLAHQVIVERAPGTTTLAIVSSLIMKYSNCKGNLEHLKHNHTQINIYFKILIFPLGL